jgi:hypothetical protein
MTAITSFGGERAGKSDGIALRATATVGHYRRQLLATDMDLWIQPCTQCADLYGKPAAEPPHQDVTLNSAPRVEAHHTCVRCRAVFARILPGSPSRQIWMLLNAGQH